MIESRWFVRDVNATPPKTPNSKGFLRIRADNFGLVAQTSDLFEDLHTGFKASVLVFLGVESADADHRAGACPAEHDHCSQCTGVILQKSLSTIQIHFGRCTRSPVQLLSQRHYSHLF